MTVHDLLHSLLDHECLLFCITDLDLIYELVTSLASVVCWFALCSRTLNLSWMNLWLTARTDLDAWMNPHL
jgi:hypothetical protein